MRETDKNIDLIFSEIYYDIDLLYITQCGYTRNMILNHLRDRIYSVESMLNTQNTFVIEPSSPVPLTEPRNQTSFTLQTLSRYNGKNGNPAYVAVNGTVYDVTDNAAWAAATHFGLAAGKDLTNEFASCHAGQNVLSRLVIVGKLI